MKMYGIRGWQPNEPHWHVAFIEADSPEQAKDILADRVAEDCDTVWADSVTPRKQWTVDEVAHPFTFILGSGCR